MFDTLEREFLEAAIDALRRLGSGANFTLPGWTITRYEIDLEAKIGLGFFSDVYRARWRGRAVAVKVITEVVPSAMFVREISIWKALDHPNVLELLGASSATSEPPWFFVSPYYKNGSLVTYLKCLDAGAPVDMLKMMNQVARGMAYLHKQDVLHGDLKGANVLVDDSLHCVISDFGQSEMKSEVVRLSGASPARTFRF
ncbi:kinase-like domain-containing protein, partial [Vararia minispora EC-137]